MGPDEVMDKRILILLSIVIIAIFAYVFFFSDKPLLLKVIDAIP